MAIDLDFSLLKLLRSSCNQTYRKKNIFYYLFSYLRAREMMIARLENQVEREKKSVLLHVHACMCAREYERERSSSPPYLRGRVTKRFMSSLKHTNVGQKKFINPNPQR